MRPTARPFPRRARALGLGIAVILAAGCAEPDPHTPVDGPMLARLAAEGQEGLRAFGRGRFEVVDYHAEAGKRVDLADPFSFHTRLYALGFTSRIRFLTKLTLPPRSELDAAIGAPGWTVEQGEDALALHEVLGEGTREPGAEATIHASAMFLDLEPGLRFERIDRAR